MKDVIHKNCISAAAAAATNRDIYMTPHTHTHTEKQA